MEVGDKVLLHSGAEKISASVVALHEGGAIDAQIEHDGHPANGAITHVMAGNFSDADGKTAAATAAASKTIHLNDYTTVTRG